MYIKRIYVRNSTISRLSVLQKYVLPKSLHAFSLIKRAKFKLSQYQYKKKINKNK